MVDVAVALIVDGRMGKYVSSQVHLALFVLAYNLGNLMRCFAFPKEVSHRSLTRKCALPRKGKR